MAAGDDYSTEEIYPGVYRQTPNWSSLNALGQGVDPYQAPTFTGSYPALSSIGGQNAIQSAQAAAPKAPVISTAMQPLSWFNWRPDLLEQWQQAGYTQLPEWLRRYAGGNYNESDLIRSYQEIANIDPWTQINNNGKMGKAAKAAFGYDPVNNVFNPKPYSFELSPEQKATFQQTWLDDKLKENRGGFGLAEMAGLGTVLLPIAIATGAWAGAPAVGAGVGAAEAGGAGALGGAAEVGGAGLGSLGGLAEAGSGGGGLFGTGATLSNPGGLGGLFGTGIGLGEGGATAGGSGGLFGTGVGAGLGNLEFMPTTVGGGTSMGFLDSLGSLFGGSGGAGVGMGNGALNSLIQGLLGIGGSYLGGEAQKDAADKSADVIWAMYNQNRADTASQRKLLEDILPSYQGLLSGTYDYSSDPIYQADKAEMVKALNRGQASRGLLNSSDTDNAMVRNLSTLMNSAYNRKYAGLLDALKIGSGAAASAGAYGANAGNALAGVYSGLGNNMANMYGGMFGAGMGALNNYQLYNLLANMKR